LSEELFDESVQANIPFLTFGLTPRREITLKDSFKRANWRNYELIDYFSGDVEDLLYDVGHYTEGNVMIGSVDILKEFLFNKDKFYGCKVNEGRLI